MPRAINNLGNVKNDPADLWLGSIPDNPMDDKEHANFIDKAHSARALTRVLQRKYLDTVTPNTTIRLIIGGHPDHDPPHEDGFAYAGDGNDVKYYVRYIEEHMNYDPDIDLELFRQDLTVISFNRLLRLMTCIVTVEKGHSYPWGQSDLLLGLGYYYRDFVKL